MRIRKNLNPTKNDAFYAQDFDDEIFMHWMLKWLVIDTQGDKSKTALKNMAKKFIEETTGEKLDTEEIEIYFAGSFDNLIYGNIIQRLLSDSSILLILNRQDKKARKYLYFRNYFDDEYSEDFLEYRGKIFRLLKKYENLEDDEEEKIKIVHFTHEKVSRYVREEIGETTVVYDREDFLKLFETFEKDIDDSIFDSYYNHKKINRKDSVDDVKEIVDLHNILQKYIETKNDKYDVYKSLTYMEWVKDEFFLQFSYTSDEDLNSIEVIELCYYTLEPLEDGFLKLMQDELKEVFDDFTIIEEFYCRREKVALMYMKFNKDTTLKEIEKKIDEIIEKLEKYNKENESLDIRNEYADMRYRRKKSKPKIKRVSIRRWQKEKSKL